MFLGGFNWYVAWTGAQRIGELIRERNSKSGGKLVVEVAGISVKPLRLRVTLSNITSRDDTGRYQGAIEEMDISVPFQAIYRMSLSGESLSGPPEEVLPKLKVRQVTMKNLTGTMNHDGKGGNLAVESLKVRGPISIIPGLGKALKEGTTPPEEVLAGMQEPWQITMKNISFEGSGRFQGNILALGELELSGNLLASPELAKKLGVPQRADATRPPAQSHGVLKNFSLTIAPSAVSPNKFGGKLNIAKIEGTSTETSEVSTSDTTLTELTLDAPDLLRQVPEVRAFVGQGPLVTTATLHTDLKPATKEIGARLDVLMHMCRLQFSGDVILREPDYKSSVIRSAKLRLSGLNDALKLMIATLERGWGRPLPREGEDIVIEASGTFGAPRIKGLWGTSSSEEPCDKVAHRDLNKVAAGLERLKTEVTDKIGRAHV